jgi:hypothetical protein
MAWHDTDMQRSSLVNDEAEMASALPRKALDPDAPPVQVVDPVSDPPAGADRNFAYLLPRPSRRTSANGPDTVFQPKHDRAVTTGTAKGLRLIRG